MSRVSRPVVSRLASVSFVYTFVSLSLSLFPASDASAQTTDVIGVRAQGMAGAFTAFLKRSREARQATLLAESVAAAPPRPAVSSAVPPVPAPSSPGL